MSTTTDYDRSDIAQIGVRFIDGEMEFMTSGGVDELEERIDNMFSWEHFSGAIECVIAYDAAGDELAELSADAYFGRTKQEFQEGRREGF